VLFVQTTYRDPWHIRKTIAKTLPRRWLIERSFAWLGRNRRLARDFERLLEVSTAMVVLAIIQLLIRRRATA
jgi:putative transposase